MRLPQDIIDQVMIYTDKFEKCIGISPYAASKLYNPLKHTLVDAIKNNDLKYCKWIFTKNKYIYTDHSKIIEIAEIHNDFSIIKWLISVFDERDKIHIIKYLSAFGHLNIAKSLYIKYNIKKGNNISAGLLNIAHENGTLDTIKFIYENFTFKFEREYYSRAAISGKLDILKWLHENYKCKTSLKSIMKNGHFHVVIWLYENDLYIMPDNPVECIVEGGNLDMLIWLYKLYPKYFDIDMKSVMNKAAVHGHLNIIQWLYENGFFENIENIIKYASISKSKNIIIWIFEKHSDKLTDRSISMTYTANYHDIVKDFITKNLDIIYKYQYKWYKTYCISKKLNFKKK